MFCHTFWLTHVQTLALHDFCKSADEGQMAIMLIHRIEIDSYEHNLIIEYA